MKIFICLLISSFFSYPSKAGGFIDKDGKKLKQYDNVWNFVNKEVGDCPKKVIFKLDVKKNSFSRFNGYPPRVILAKKPEHKNFKMVLAHETAHVCLYNKTKKMSNKEQFRFFDEGLADMIGGGFVGGEKLYKKKAFKRAQKKLQERQISFDLVQNWKSYFGSPPKVNYDAYMVGATFNYYVIEKYGRSKLNQFFISIGNTQSLKDSILKTFKVSPVEFETKWLEYIRSR